MLIDSNSILTALGTLGACSLYINVVSYYGTKHRLNRISNKYGKEVADNFIEREVKLHKSRLANLIGGVGVKLAARKYKEGYFDNLIEKEV